MFCLNSMVKDNLDIICILKRDFKIETKSAAFCVIQRKSSKPLFLLCN